MGNILGKGETGFGILIEDDAGYVSAEISPYNKNLYENFLNENFTTSSLKGGKILVDCILQKYGIENRNGRIYPKEVLYPQVEKYMQSVKDNSAVSEADHPESSVVSLKNISHIIKEMWWGQGKDENVLYGKLEIITSPAYINHGQVCMIGDKIVEYLRRGIKLGISSRGVGSLQEVKGKNIVQNDYDLICFDLVASPSTPGAYLFPKMDGQTAGGSIQEKNTISQNSLIVETKFESALDKFLNS
jgi:hypothetical protein